MAVEKINAQTITVSCPISTLNEGRTVCRKQMRIEPLEKVVKITIEQGYSNNVDLELICSKKDIKSLFESLY